MTVARRARILWWGTIASAVAILSVSVGWYLHWINTPEQQVGSLLAELRGDPLRKRGPREIPAEIG